MPLDWWARRFLLPDAIPLYFQGEIGKYIPGSVWAVLGRGELARREGLSRSSSYASVVSSLAALYLGGALTAALLLPFAAGATGSLAVVGVVAFLVVGLLGLHPAVVGRVLALGQRITKRSLDVAVPSCGATRSRRRRLPPGMGSHRRRAYRGGPGPRRARVVFGDHVCECGVMVRRLSRHPGARRHRRARVGVRADQRDDAHQRRGRGGAAWRGSFSSSPTGLGALLGAAWMTRRPSD